MPKPRTEPSGNAASMRGMSSSDRFMDNASMESFRCSTLVVPMRLESS